MTWLDTSHDLLTSEDYNPSDQHLRYLFHRRNTALIGKNTNDQSTSTSVLISTPTP